jgi:hypothetical protein
MQPLKRNIGYEEDEGRASKHIRTGEDNGAMGGSQSGTGIAMGGNAEGQPELNDDMPVD